MSTQLRMDPYRQGPLFQHMRVPDAGQIFYVHRASNGGDDANDGRTPQTAMLTIEEALDRCTTGANDYIYVMRHDAATETWPITVSKSYVHIIGTPFQASPTPLIQPNTDNHGFNLTGGGGVEIAGFNFGMDHTYVDACINQAAGWMNHIHHNWFAWSTEAHDCIRLAGGGGQTRINNNFFGAHGFDGYAIEWMDNSTGRVHIHDNVIIVEGMETQGVRGIHMTGHANVVLRNTFLVPASAHGEAISAGGAGNALIDHNHAAGPAAGMGGNNPYGEVAGSVNYWGANWASNALVLPQAI